MVIRINGGDPFDPNNWVPDDYEHRIYATDDLSLYVVVSAIDYPWLVQWKWTPHDLRRYERTGLLYLKRIITEFTDPEGPKYISPHTGKLVRNFHRVQRTRFIHQEIMLRTGIPQPTPAHKEVDHILPKRTWDCRRENLQWATRGMQVSSANRGIVRGVALVNRQSRQNVREGGQDRSSGGDGSL